MDLTDTTALTTGASGKVGALASEIRRAHGRDVPVDSAWFGPSGRLAETTDLTRVTVVVTLHCTTPTDLTARLLPGMVERRRGVGGRGGKRRRTGPDWPGSLPLGWSCGRSGPASPTARPPLTGGVGCMISW